MPPPGLWASIGCIHKETTEETRLKISFRVILVSKTRGHFRLAAGLLQIDAARYWRGFGQMTGES
jgi:hypothetical protein